MRSPIQSVDAETPVVDALRLSQARGMHHMPLFKGSQLLGVVCTCDLEEVALEAPVGSAIQGPPVVLDVGATIEDAVRVMNESLVGSVLVMRQGDAVGLVTREDLVRANAQGAAAMRCEACGGVTHLRRVTRGARILCLDCRANSGPSSLDEDELGGSG